MTVIDVVTSGIRAHAARVEGIGNDIDTARSAAGQVSMQGEAYGILCSPVLVPVLGTLEGAGIVAIATAAAAVDGTALALRAMAASLDLVDDIASNIVTAAGDR